MALFASNISEFNFKRNAAKPAVVTRTFFRHLNIITLKVCRIDNTCITCFCRKWILFSGTELLHFHWLTIHFRKSDQATLIGGVFLKLTTSAGKPPALQAKFSIVTSVSFLTKEHFVLMF